MTKRGKKRETPRFAVDWDRVRENGARFEALMQPERDARGVGWLPPNWLQCAVYREHVKKLRRPKRKAQTETRLRPYNPIPVDNVKRGKWDIKKLVRAHGIHGRPTRGRSYPYHSTKRAIAND